MQYVILIVFAELPIENTTTNDITTYNILPKMTQHEQSQTQHENTSPFDSRILTTEQDTTSYHTSSHNNVMVYNNYGQIKHDNNADMSILYTEIHSQTIMIGILTIFILFKVCCYTDFHFMLHCHLCIRM